MTANRSTKTVVVIPSRNRADLAMRSVQSVLHSPDGDLQLIVSDNSTAPADRTSLEAFCRDLSDPRLLYISPSKSLSMTQHWDWVMSQALQRCNPDYLIYLTDRSLFKPGALPAIISLAKLHSEKVISYDWVTIFDHLRPISVERQPQTGQLLEISALRLLFLSSRSIFPRCLPRMMNCCVPRPVIEKIRDRFGNVFASSSPDYNFAYRCLEIVESILFHDQAAFISHAIPRSTGAGLGGIPTDGSRDFWACQELEGRPRNFATPFPTFNTAINYMVHEYCLARREHLGGNFPRLSISRYLLKNIRALLLARLRKFPVLVSALLAKLWRRNRASPGQPVAAFDSVEDAINYAITASSRPGESMAHFDPSQRE